MGSGLEVACPVETGTGACVATEVTTEVSAQKRHDTHHSGAQTSGRSLDSFFLTCHIAHIRICITWLVVITPH